MAPPAPAPDGPLGPGGGGGGGENRIPGPSCRLPAVTRHCPRPRDGVTVVGPPVRSARRQVGCGAVHSSPPPGPRPPSPPRQCSPIHMLAGQTLQSRLRKTCCIRAHGFTCMQAPGKAPSRVPPGVHLVHTLSMHAMIGAGSRAACAWARACRCTAACWCCSMLIKHPHTAGRHREF